MHEQKWYLDNAMMLRIPMIIGILSCIIVLQIVFSLLELKKTVSISRTLIAKTTPFRLVSANADLPVLVLGDSTAVGVGANQTSESLPALFAAHVGATMVENYASSGATVVELSSQIARAERSHYRYILVQIGANDVTSFHAAGNTARLLEAQLATLPAHDHLVVLMAGNVGGAPAIPWFLKAYFHRQSVHFHAAFKEVVEAQGGTYVELYDPPDTDPFIRNPLQYFAPDGFHPSSLGYKLWFEKLKKQVPEN